MRDFTNLLCGIEAAAHENPQLEIDPSYDDVEEDQPIDRAHDLKEIVFGGYAAQKIAKDRLVGEEALAGSIDRFDFAIDGFASRTIPPDSLRIHVILAPSLNHAQEGAHLAHDLERKRSSCRRDRLTTNRHSFARPPDDILASQNDFSRYATSVI